MWRERVKVTCTVLLLDSSVCSHALRDSSVTNISTALDNISGTSELIIWRRGGEEEEGRGERKEERGRGGGG